MLPILDFIQNREARHEGATDRDSEVTIPDRKLQGGISLEHGHLAELIPPKNHAHGEAEDNDLPEFIQGSHQGGGKAADENIQPKMTPLLHGQGRPHENAPLKEKKSHLFGPDQRCPQNKAIKDLEKDHNRQNGRQTGTDDFKEPF